MQVKQPFKSLIVFGLQVVHLYNEMRKLLPDVMEISYCETQRPRRPPLSKEIDKVILSRVQYSNHLLIRTLQAQFFPSEGKWRRNSS